MITVDEDRVDATPDLKNAPVGVDCLPDSDLSDSRVEPGAGVPTSELQASHSDANGGTTISKLIMRHHLAIHQSSLKHPLRISLLVLRLLLTRSSMLRLIPRRFQMMVGL
ncbi:unnamed protein product [Lathyrus oleraceus]